MRTMSLPLALLLILASVAESVWSAPATVRTYQGLYSTDASHLEPVGAITVTIRSSETFTGSYRSNGQKVPFRGFLASDSTAVVDEIGGEERVVYDNETDTYYDETLYRELNFALDPAENELTGTLTSEGEATLYFRAIAKASPEEIAGSGFAGKYTLRFSDGVLPGQGDFGNGFATLNVSASGSIRMAGRLADGTPFAYKSMIGGNGAFPFDVAMHKGRTSARGWLTLVGSSDAEQAESDLGGQVIWKSDLQTIVKKRNFFTEFETSLLVDGSRYTPPTNGVPILDLSTPLVRLSAGDLRRPLNREMAIRGAKISTNWKTTRFSLSATPGSGALSGKFFHPATGTKRPFYGVVLQKQNVAAGFFLGTNVGGRMSLAEKDIRSIGFDNPESDVIAILPAQEEGEPSIVILRDENPDVAHRVVLILADGTVIEAVSDSNERLAELTLGSHRFVLSNYTATTVNVTYHAPDGSVTTNTLPLAEGARSMALSPAKSRMASSPASMRRFFLTEDDEEVDEEQLTVDERVERTLNFVADISNTHLIVNLYRSIGETLADVGSWVADKIGKGIDHVTGSPLEIPPDVNDSEQWRALAEQAPALVNESVRIDPDGVADAGLYATEDGIHPQRDEWDRLARNRQIDTSFDLADSPPEQSVFAQMNPNSPGYIPPAQLTAQNILLATPKDTAVTGVFGGTSMDYFRVVRRPENGKVTIIDLAAGTFRYDPKPGHEGVEQFTYVAVNRNDKSSPAVVTIEVGRGALAAHDLILETDLDTEISQQLGGSGAASFEVVREPKHGTLTLTDPVSGAFTYQPNPGYKGKDSFSFVAINERGRSEEGVVTIQVKKGPETANEWEKILLGKWRVVEHPYLKEETKRNGIYENWTVEFTKDFNNAGLRVAQQFVQFFEDFDGDGPKRFPVRYSDFYPYFLFGKHKVIVGEEESPETWMLSYNGNKENGHNIALISFSGGKLRVHFGDDFIASALFDRETGEWFFHRYADSIGTLVKE